MRFQVYQRLTIRGRRWFWRLLAGNHRIIAVGGEGFVNRGDVLDVIQTMTDGVRVAPVEVFD